MSVLIPLSRCLFSIIDDDDLERVSRLKWFAGGRLSGRFIAVANVNGRQVQLHRFVMNAEDGQILDHIDRDALNNQKANLRFCTHSQNGANRRNKIAFSGFRGVCTTKPRGDSAPRYFAQAKCNGKVFRSPRRDRAEEAAADYDAMMMKLFGDFATMLNFPSARHG